MLLVTLILACVAPSIATWRIGVAARTESTANSGTSSPYSFSLALLFIYAITFNLLPDSSRVTFAALIAVAIVGLGAVQPGNTRASATAALLLTAGLLGIVLYFPLLVRPADGGTFFDTAQVLLPIVGGFFIVSCYRRFKIDILVTTALASGLTGSLFSLSQGLEYVGNVSRLTPFTGGEDGVHASSYFLLTCALIAIETAISKPSRRKLALFALIPMLLALALFAVSTVLLMLATYSLTRSWPLLRSFGRRVVLVLIFSIGAVAVAVQRLYLRSNGEFIQSTTGLNGFSAGRLDAWRQRWELVSTRGLDEVLLGSGAGSDLIAGSGWTGEKNSHQDFLTIFYNYGLLALLLIVAGYALIFAAAGPRSAPFAVTFIAGSLVSNALATRPALALTFFVSLAVAARLNSLRPEPLLGEPHATLNAARSAG